MPTNDEGIRAINQSVIVVPLSLAKSAKVVSATHGSAVIVYDDETGSIDDIDQDLKAIITNITNIPNVELRPPRDAPPTVKEW